MLFGAVLTGTEVSEWLYLTVLSGAFYFSLGKRRNELQKKKDGDTRKVLKYYTRDFLDKKYVYVPGTAQYILCIMV